MHRPHSLSGIRALSVLCAFLHGTLAAQEIVEKKHDNGTVAERYEVDENGQRDGESRRFRPDGSLEQLAHYESGRLDGLRIDYDAGGVPVAEARFRRGKRNGKSKRFAEGRLISEAQYKNDLLDGKSARYDADGITVFEGRYRKGQLHGKVEKFDPATERRHEARYRNGLRHGKAEVSVGKNVVSAQEWDDGRLVRLDRIEPFPIARDTLVETLRVANDPGALPEEEKEASRVIALTRLKVYRALCGLDWREMELVPEWNDLCDAASEVCEALGRLSHTPERPPGFDADRYQKGYRGAKSSNLASGGVRGSVDSYMDDSDPSNIDRVGHRRWCLNPPMRKTGFGVSGRYSAMWAFDKSGSTPKGLEAVLYPPAGYVPSDLFGPRHAWSIICLRGSVPRKSQVVVTIQPLDEDYAPEGEPLTIETLHRAEGGFGRGDCLVFRPEGRLRCVDGARYRVRVSFDGGRTNEFDYVVEFIEPLGPPRAADR